MPDDKECNQPSENSHADPSAPGPPEATIEQRIMALEADSRTRDKTPISNKLASDIKDGELWLIWINGFAAVVSFAIGIIYLHQLTEMQKVTNATRVAAESSQEAVEVELFSRLPHISPAGVTVKWDHHQSPLVITQNFVNDGDSAAIQPVFHWGWGDSIQSPANFPVYGWKDTSSSKGSREWDKQNMSLEEAKQHAFGSTPLYFVGWATYGDLFPLSKGLHHVRNDHRVEWVVRIDNFKLSGEKPKLEGTVLSNCVDTQCPKYNDGKN